MAKNSSRPNGKAWKKKWGEGGPPAAVLEQARDQSVKSKRKKGNS